MITATLFLFVVASRVFINTLQADEKTPSIQELIQRAGNANEDAERLRILKTLREHPQLSEETQVDLNKLIEQVDRWENRTPMTYFGRSVINNQDYDFGIPEESPVYSLTLLYRGRMILRTMFGYGGYWGTDQKRSPLHNRAREFFEKYKELYPENKIARMYLGELIPAPKQYESVAGAPEWAIYQREGLERLTDVITWWIEHRERPDGQYGGGWADDCEMWRWWVPVLIGFEDPQLIQAQARFSNALLNQKHMKKGYTTHVYDVEHTAEDSADTLTPMMYLDPENEEWKERTFKLVDLMENFWTGTNKRGMLQFKSTYFSVDRIDPSPERACDTVYHPRVIQPALLYWQRTGDQRIGNLVTRWMDTWVDATERAERGKPAGVIPSAIHWPDGQVGGLDERWWAPKNHGESKLYYWPSSMTMMLNTLLLTHHMTENEKYLKPIQTMAQIRLDYLKNRPKNIQPGSVEWCGAKLRRMDEVAAKFKFLTGRSDFDDLLKVESSPYISYRLTGDRQSVVEALQKNAKAFRVNFEGYTSEVRFTDRILSNPKLYLPPIRFARPKQEVYLPDPKLLYCTVTGDPGEAGYFPMSAVRWLTSPRNIAAFVKEALPDRFEAELFHFGEEPRPMTAELYLLKPGNYTLTMEPVDRSDPLERKSELIQVTGQRTRVSFELPARKTYVIRVKRNK